MKGSTHRTARTAEVRDLMTDRVFTLRAKDDCEALHDLMDTHHVRHVPIVDKEGDLVRLVTQRDLARNALGAQDTLPLSMQQEILRRRKVREIMATEVETVEPDADLEMAAQMLLENKIGCLPVVEGKHVVGILTESDFVRRYVEMGDGRRRASTVVAFAVLLSAFAAVAMAGPGSIDGFSRIDERVAVGAQPTPEQVVALSDQGFNGIINLREEAEFNDGTLSQAARNAGMRFVRVPISARKPSDGAVEAFLAATDDADLYPVFVYCASGNRAAALWMVRRVLRDGWVPADAEIEAERAGLKSPEMREFARDYIRRQLAGRAAAP